MGVDFANPGNGTSEDLILRVLKMPLKGFQQESNVIELISITLNGLEEDKLESRNSRKCCYPL